MGTRQHRSFRFDPDTLARLEQRARTTRLTQTALVERYVDEGLRRDDHPEIIFVDEAAGRRPRLAGTGLDVWEIVVAVQDNSGSVSETAAYLDMPEWRIVAAMHYYADYRYEIDAWIAENDRMAEEEELRTRRVAEAFR